MCSPDFSIFRTKIFEVTSKFKEKRFHQKEFLKSRHS